MLFDVDGFLRLVNLPNYFIADLPPEATITASMLSDACLALKRNREKYLLGRSTRSLIDIIAETANSWLTADSPFRLYATEAGPAQMGLPAATIEQGLTEFFQQLTLENLNALVGLDLGHRERLDHFVASDVEGAARIMSRARGPECIAHFTAGIIPNPTFTSLILGLLGRSAQFVKCARGSSFLPRLFAHSLYQLEPKLGACIEIAEWPGAQRPDLAEVLFTEVDAVTASGTDETLRAIRDQLPIRTRFLGYGDRLSFGFISRDAIGSVSNAVIAAAADDVIAWNQLGCLSPHLFYVEEGGRLPAREFGQLLALELDRRETTHPRGPLPHEVAAVIASRRDFYRIRAAHRDQIGETHLWESAQSTAWTVVYEDNPLFQVSCLNRFVYVKPVGSLEELLQAADTVRGKVSTIGLAAPEDSASRLAEQFAQWGVTRICPLGRMQRPPLSWRHDGRPALGDLVTWTNWEQ